MMERMHSRLAVLGATGSIGRQALEVAASHADHLRVTVRDTDENDRLIAAAVELALPAPVAAS